MRGVTGWGPPRVSIEAEIARRGLAGVVRGCRELLGGSDSDFGLIVALAGPGPASPFAPGMPPRSDTYWLRVWAARGLLWAYDASADQDIVTALRDEHWRVREMALKVVARHTIDEGLEEAARLQSDSVPRVAAAAHRAVRALTSP